MTGSPNSTLTADTSEWGRLEDHVIVTFCFLVSEEFDKETTLTEKFATEERR